MQHRILIISSEPNYPNIFPGLSIFARDWQEHLENENIKSEVLSFQKIFFLRYLRIEGFSLNFFSNFRYLSLFPNWSLISGITSFVKMFIFFFKIRHAKTYDLIICNNFVWAGFCSIFLHWMHKTKIILVEHNANMIVKNKSFIHQILFTKTMKINTDCKLYCVSKSFKDQIKKELNIDANLISNVIPLPLLDGLKYKNNKFKLISIGSLDHNKDQLFQIKILQTLPDNYSLTIIGDGPNHEMLKKYIQDQRISDRVKLLGELSRLSVKQHLDSASILLNTSYLETFGVVNIEAGSRGLKIVSFDNGGVWDSTLPINRRVVKTRILDEWSKDILSIEASKVTAIEISNAYRAKFGNLKWVIKELA